MKTKIALATATVAAGLCLTASASSNSYGTTPEVQLGRVLGAWTASAVPEERRKAHRAKTSEVGRAVGQAVGSLVGLPAFAEFGAA